MRIFGTLIFSADSFFNGRRIGDMTDQEREQVRRHFLAKGARQVVFTGIEPYYTKEIIPEENHETEIENGGDTGLELNG